MLELGLQSKNEPHNKSILNGKIEKEKGKMNETQTEETGQS